MVHSRDKTLHQQTAVSLPQSLQTDNKTGNVVYQGGGKKPIRVLHQRVLFQRSLPSPVTACTTLLSIKALVSLDPSKAMGVDELPPKILKSCYQPINHLFLNKSYIPAEWKMHLITPIHKSGDLCMIDNYRPISLLRAISKVLESCIIDFVSKAINLAFCGENLQSNIPECSHVDAIYLDFRKAFDMQRTPNVAMVQGIPFRQVSVHIH